MDSNTKTIHPNEDLIKSLLQQLSEILQKSKTSNILFGFDGFIDNIFQVLKKRHSLTEYIPMEKISEFSERIAAASGSSANMEVLSKKQSTGGFVANTCRGIATLQDTGKNITMIGCFGLPEPDSLFIDLFVKTFQCSMISIGNPGKTNAYEFADGKIMISEFTGVHKLTVETILKGCDNERLIQAISNSDLFGIGYWSIGPHMTEIFKELLEIMKKIGGNSKKRKLFFDLADVKKKPVEDLLVALGILKDFSTIADVTVSVNDKEAESLALALGIELLKTSDNHTNFAVVGGEIFKKLKITRFVIHSPKTAFGWSITDANEIKSIIVPQAYASKAKFTTSAGDMFNSGLCVALLSDRPLDVSLLMGNIMSAFFIRTGKAPGPEEFQGFLQNYYKYLESDKSEII